MAATIRVERCKKKRKDLHDDAAACEARARVGTMSMGTLEAPDTPTSEMLGALGLGMSSLARGQQGMCEGRNKKQKGVQVVAVSVAHKHVLVGGTL